MHLYLQVHRVACQTRRKRVQTAFKWHYNVKSASGNVKAVRKQWTDQQMQDAIDNVTRNHLSANAAAKKHGAPPSVLKDRLNG